jgi:hypothetical protein
MKHIFAVSCLPVALLMSLPVLAAAAPAKHKTITCPFLQDGSLKFDVPAEPKDLPEVDFDYPSKATLFSFRDGNLLLVAMDEASPRVCAPWFRRSSTRRAQAMTDKSWSTWAAIN